jgi:hypothetical protein
MIDGTKKAYSYAKSLHGYMNLSQQVFLFVYAFLQIKANKPFL